MSSNETASSVLVLLVLILNMFYFPVNSVAYVRLPSSTRASTTSRSVGTAASSSPPTGSAAARRSPSAGTEVSAGKNELSPNRED